jgi:solute carrier family 1 (high affinity glutamate transporter) protein 2
LANYSNFTLNTIDYVIVLIETSILCTCLPSIPSSSIITILVVLNSINLNGSNLAILYTVEWLLDCLRTTVNLYSHDFCAVITNHLLMNSNYNNNNEIELIILIAKKKLLVFNLSYF